VLWARERIPTPPSSIVFHLDSHLSPSRSWECVIAHGSSVHQKCSNYALTNLLCGLCKFVWIIDSLVICPSPHPRTLAPSTPKVLRATKHTQLLILSLFSTLDSRLSLSRSLGVYQKNSFPFFLHFTFSLGSIFSLPTFNLWSYKTNKILHKCRLNIFLQWNF
jgi:hypothetical protein